MMPSFPLVVPSPDFGLPSLVLSMGEASIFDFGSGTNEERFWVSGEGCAG